MPTATSSAPQKRPKFFRRGWFRLLVFLVALAAVIRWTWLDIRRIPTSSMVPTLIGDDTPGAPFGDRVVLRRFFFKNSIPPRYSLVTASHPMDNRREMVKRVVGLPLERVQIAGGNIIINGKLLQKGRCDWQDQRVVLMDSRVREMRQGVSATANVTFDESGALLRGAESSHAKSGAALTLQFSPTDGYQSENGTYHPGDHSVEELELEVEVQWLGEGGTLYMDLRKEGDDYHLEIERNSKSGATTLRLDWAYPESAPKETSGVRWVNRVLLQTRGPVWAAAETKTLAFRNVDDQLSLEIGGQEAITPIEIKDHHPFQRGNDIASLPPRPVGPRVGVYGSEARIRRFTTYRDLHYLSMGKFAAREPFELGPAELFLLGDCSSESSDSREFGAIPLKLLTGRLVAILSPWNRRRWME